MKLSIAFATIVSIPALALAQARSSPQQFVQQAAQIHMQQAHLGQMAAQKAASPELKEFGQQLEQEHAQAYQQLSRIAGQNGWKVPQALDRQHMQSIQQLANTSGPAFDRQFKQQELQNQQHALSLFQKEAQQGQNADLKQYASHMASVMHGQRQTAENLGQNQNQAATPRTDNSGENMAGQGMPAKVEHGTVTRYEPGRMLQLKVRNRLGRHIYDLSAINARIPSNLSPGTQVTVIESVDPNGRRSIQVQPENGAQTGNGSQTPAR